MFNVACFCGCCYSFSKGAGACARCGKTAAVSVPSPGARTACRQARPETLVLTDGQRTLVLADVSSGVGGRYAARPVVTGADWALQHRPAVRQRVRDHRIESAAPSR